MPWTYYSLDPPDTDPQWQCADCRKHEVAGIMANPDLGEVWSEERGIHLETVAWVPQYGIIPMGNALGVAESASLPALFCTPCYQRRREIAKDSGWKLVAENSDA